MDDKILTTSATTGDKPLEPIIGTAEAVLTKLEPPEGEPFHISFAEHNDKECMIGTMHQDSACIALRVLRDVGLYFTDELNFCVKSDGVAIKPVHNDKGYTDLFRGLSEQFKDSVREIVYDKPSKNIQMRLFFTTLETERLFYVIAVQANAHYDTDKGKKTDHRDRPWRQGRGRR